jgi:5-(carboxyamino)imidazole ribonucleotide synthase
MQRGDLSILKKLTYKFTKNERIKRYFAKLMISGKKQAQQLKIGILGGGQLGRMLIQNAINYNLNIYALDPDKNAPCKHLVQKFSQGSLTDYDTVYEFGKDKDLITIEIENVNIEALKQLEKEGKMVYPQPHLIELIQDKTSKNVLSAQ